MEWIKNISASDVIMVLCGLCTLAYCVSQVAEKFFGSMQWYQKIKADKKKKEREEHFAEWKDFYLEVKNEQKPKEKEELKQLYDEFTEGFVEKYADKVIEEIHKTDEAQNEKIDKLITSSNDMLRKELVTMYYHYLPYKKITIYMKKSFMKLYQDYHEQGGNSFIDEIYREVITWDVVESEEEIVGEVKN